MYKIYISSTYSDLQKQRQDAIRTILDLKHHPVAMEDYNSTSEKPLDQCLKDIRDCDIFVGIYGFRYGFIPEGHEKSITHLEYDEACKWEKTRLLFVADDDAPIPVKYIDEDRTRIKEFRQLVLNELVCTILKDLGEFGKKLAASIHNAEPGPDQKPTPSIPRILPYLSNRSIQVTELEMALDDCEDCLHTKPLVCIIHGDEMECHDKFIKRLHEVMLPKTLIGAGDVPVELTPVEWPSMKTGLKMRYKKLTYDIAQALTGNRRAKINEIKNELNGRIAALMIYSTLPVAAWEDNESELIEKWLQYWNEFPELNAGKKLMVFLCIKYKSLSNIADEEAENYSNRNTEARKFIQSLKFETYPNISPLILTELKSIEYGDVDKWIEMYAPECCDDTKLRNNIMKFFDCRKNKAVPMLELAVKLNELLLLTQIKQTG